MNVKYDCSEDVATVSLNRPDRMNALNEDVLLELQQAVQRAGDEARLVVLTGEGRAFCAGADLKDPLLEKGMSIHEIRSTLRLAQNVIQSIRELRIPVVCRINGAAMGAGCDLALAGDFRIAARDAVLCQSFVNVGVVSGDGGAFQLPRLVGETRAKEMVMMGKEVSGQTLEEWGLVNRVCPPEQLDEEVDSYVDQLLKRSPTALGFNKQLINESFNQTLEEAFNSAVIAMWGCLQSDDYDRAREAFMNRSSSRD